MIAAMLRADDLYFRLRGWIPIPLYAAVLARTDLAPPSRWELALGAALAAAGLALRLAARAQMGRSSDTRRLHAQRLITEGVYRRVRNPIYLGNQLIATGLATLCGADGWALALAAALFLHYRRVIQAEERMLTRCFGASYAAYCRTVPRLLPRLPMAAARRSLAPLRREARIVAMVVSAAVVTIWLRFS